MKILHVTTVPATLNFLVGQLSALTAGGWDVHVASSPNADLHSIAAAEGATAHSVPMTRSLTPLQEVRAAVAFVRLMRRLSPDVVHTHTPKASLLAAFAAWLTGVPVRIVHLHGLVETTATGWRRCVLQWSTRMACAFATQVLAVSPSVRELAIQQRSCPRWKVLVPASGSISGVDAQGRFNPRAYERLVSRSALRIESAAFVIGFVGRFARDKGLADLLVAWQRVRAAVPEAFLLLVGEADPVDAVPDDVMSRFRRDPRVRIVAGCREPAPYYACMDLFVLPTYREGLPTVILEAAAMHLPVVATEVAGCVDAVINGVTGTLVRARDPEQLAAAILPYRDDESRRRAHGRSGRAFVLRRFRPHVVWAAISDVYSRQMVLCERRRTIDAFSRCADVIISTVAMLLLAPVIGAVAAGVWIGLGRPILFRQVRSGLRGRPFDLVKFRTMSELRDAGGQLLPDAQRISRLGALLRAFSFDELPQLWNVLRGDMSLVGPRPLPVEYEPRYTMAQLRRLSVKPGITGWAQVNGRNRLDWDSKFRLDCWYVSNRSLWLNLRILVRTPLEIARRRGITHPGHVSMPEFGVTQNAVRAETERAA